MSPHSSGMLKIKKKQGRNRLLKAHACLGLTFMWTCTQGSSFDLSMIFGIIQSTASISIRFGWRILFHVLSSEEDAQVKLPTSMSVINAYKEAVAARHPRLGDENVGFSVDGTKLHIQKAGDEAIQNMFYNGWTHSHYVGNVFVFAPDGCIVAMCINAPGSVHDSAIAYLGSLYTKLHGMFQRFNVKCVADSAFMAAKNEYIIRSSQKCPVGYGDTIRL